jgi:hypothetical protein
MSKYLSFNLNLHDPNAFTKTLILNESPYIAHVFLKVPIYDDFNVQIGYKVANNYIQQLTDNQYSIKINSTYYFYNNNSSVNWEFCFINDTPNYYYPLNTPNASNIISTTGEYLGKTGVVSLIAKEDGSRYVTVCFNF